MPFSGTGTRGLAVCAPGRYTVFSRQDSQRKGLHDRLQRCCGQAGVLLYTPLEPASAALRRTAGVTHRSLPECPPRLMQAEEHPRSGIAGLRHWRYDLEAGLRRTGDVAAVARYDCGAQRIARHRQKGFHRNEDLQHTAIGSVFD